MSFSKKRKEIEGGQSSREALENDEDDGDNSGSFLSEDAMKAMNRQKRPVMKHGKSTGSSDQSSSTGGIFSGVNLLSTSSAVSSSGGFAGSFGSSIAPASTFTMNQSSTNISSSSLVQPPAFSFSNPNFGSAPAFGVAPPPPPSSSSITPALSLQGDFKFGGSSFGLPTVPAGTLAPTTSTNNNSGSAFNFGAQEQPVTSTSAFGGSNTGFGFNAPAAPATGVSSFTFGASASTTSASPPPPPPSSAAPFSTFSFGFGAPPSQTVNMVTPAPVVAAPTLAPSLKVASPAPAPTPSVAPAPAATSVAPAPAATKTPSHLSKTSSSSSSSVQAPNRKANYLQRLAALNKGFATFVDKSKRDPETLASSWVPDVQRYIQRMEALETEFADVLVGGVSTTNKSTVTKKEPAALPVSKARRAKAILRSCIRMGMFKPKKPLEYVFTAGSLTAPPPPVQLPPGVAAFSLSRAPSSSEGQAPVATGGTFSFPPSQSSSEISFDFNKPIAISRSTTEALPASFSFGTATSVSAPLPIPTPAPAPAFMPAPVPAFLPTSSAAPFSFTMSAPTAAVAQAHPPSSSSTFTPFSFGSSFGSTTTAPAPAPAPFSFGAPSSGSFSFLSSQPLVSAGAGQTSSTRNDDDDDGGGGGGEEEGRDGPQGEGERPSEKGVVLLAADDFNKKILTDSETIAHQVRVSVQRFTNKAWVSLNAGDVRIIRNNTTGASRIVFNNPTSEKLLIHSQLGGPEVKVGDASDAGSGKARFSVDLFSSYKYIYYEPALDSNGKVKKDDQGNDLKDMHDGKHEGLTRYLFTTKTKDQATQLAAAIKACKTAKN